MADSSGREFTYRRTLVASLVMAISMRRRFGKDHRVGILLPPSTVSAILNIALPMAGKVPVNLNYTIGREVLTCAIERASIGRVITSRAFVERSGLHLEGALFLEDMGPSPMERLKGVFLSLLPAGLLLSLFRSDPNRTATILFSSGSTGRPKGIVLSHRAIASNVDALERVCPVGRGEKVMGVLPFFHSFGYTVTLWFPLLKGIGAVYHPNPLDGKGVGEAVSRYRPSLLLATPTFCDIYLRQCRKEDLSSIRFCIVGGEKLKMSTCRAFRERFGAEILEGYGCTEMGPVVSVNLPGRNRVGTVGPPIPGTMVKVVDPESLEALPPGREGLVLVKGPSMMDGYLDDPGATAEVLRDGWYVTGDVGSIDEEGFLTITDRLSRFSKIGGEMVPHLRIEEAVKGVTGKESVVVSLFDEDGRERLVCFHTHPGMDGPTIRKGLLEKGLPSLWIPKEIHFIESIPLLGSGKVDLQKVKALALERFHGP